MVASGKLSFADITGKWFDPSVLSIVSSELVTAGEAFTAARVVTRIGLFTCVLSDMHLKVRQLKVSLVTVWMLAGERLQTVIFSIARFSSWLGGDGNRNSSRFNFLSHCQGIW
jgi:hypothetical protein